MKRLFYTLIISLLFLPQVQANTNVAYNNMATGGVRSVYSLIKGKNILQQKDLEGLIKAINSASPEDLKAVVYQMWR